MGADTWQDAKDMAVAGFLDDGPAHLNCAQAVVAFAAATLGLDPRLVLAARYMGGGSVGMGHLCGALSGAILAPGLRDFFSGAEWPDSTAPDKAALQRLMRDFEAEFGTATCLGLTGHDISSKEGYRDFKRRPDLEAMRRLCGLGLRSFGTHPQRHCLNVSMERRRCTVHLSGPLSGCNPQQRRLWRDEFKRLCPDMLTIDPSEWADEWDFSRDLRAVAACDVVVANMWKESIGTTIEIMQARARGRPVVLIDPNHLDHAILRGLIAPEKPVHSVKEAAARVRVLVQELGGFTVVKKDGSSESFDRDKLMRSLKLACAEAGIDDLEFPNQILGPVMVSLRRAAATRVVSTSDIKNAVFDEIDA